jgi:hypothetical protein
MAQTGTAVPPNVNLSRTKPYAVSAYTRRVKSLANNAQSFGPDSYVNITLDTSTPGSFLDPLQSYLKFDLTFENSNPFADYVSFGSAGAASIIEEFRIYVQGTPIEEILQYNVFYELAMNQNGQCQQPFNMFRTNPTNQGVSGVFLQNAIKPPMVDFDGRPMYGSVRHTSTGIAQARSCTWASSGDGFFLNAQMIASQATMASKICFSGCRPYYSGATNSATKYFSLVADAHALLTGNPSCEDDATAGLGVCQGTAPTVATNYSLFPGYYPDINNASRANQNNPLSVGATLTAGPNYSDVAAAVGCVADETLNSKFINGAVTQQFANYLSQERGYLPFAGSTVELPNLYGADAGADAYNPDLDPKNPLNWCSFIPATDIRPDMRTLGPDNLQDYFLFLCNTKYIPIGMPGFSKEDPSSFSDPLTQDPALRQRSSNNFRNIRQYNPQSPSRFTYTCCVPLISGILGSFAEKCWPTMLVAPGSMYIQIRTATAQKAFQLSMDPCRRVLGTIRDYLPFGGSIGGLFGQFGGNATSLAPGRGNLTASSARYNTTAAGGIAPTPIPGTDSSVFGYLPRETKTPHTSPFTFGIGQANEAISVYKQGTKMHSYINGYACIGSNLATADYTISVDYLNESTFAGLVFRPYGVAAMQGQWTIGKAYVQQFAGDPTSVASFAASVNAMTEEGSNIIPNQALQGTNLNPSVSLAYVSPAQVPASRRPTAAAQLIGSVGAFVIGQGTSTATVPQADVTVELRPAGIPLPQYILHASPWNRKELFVYQDTVTKQFVFCGAKQDSIAHEADACYGTFLTSSVPQCRRVLTHNASAITSYSLSNIEFVSQQIILPDSVSASILEDAAQGDISITSNSVHNYQTPIPQSTSQNLIIPAKIASANTMYCLFVPQVYVTGAEAYLYNSLRGICPFGSVSALNGINPNGLLNSYDKTAGTLGYVNDDLAVTNIRCSSGVFQVQLKIGNELLPQQPLTCITELVAENVKAQHKLFDSTSNVNATYNLTTKLSGRLGGTAVNGLAYDALRSGNFTTTFVSAALCDDQTAINNPAMGYAYACEANYLNTASASSGQKSINNYVIKRNPHQLELFQPPESSFVLAFDMDTWSRVSDVTRSGKYLGNNTITLNLTEANALGLPNSQTLANGFTMQSFVVHDIRFSFQAGGSVVSYY